MIIREQIVNDSDRPMAIHGVNGRLTHRTVKPGQAPGLWCRQRWVSERRPVTGWGTRAYIVAEIRFDDDCSNGHNSFAVTATIQRPGARDCEACGCMHDEVAQYFPELAHLLKWHLTSSDGPLHYIANTVYHAGDRDYRGMRKGERRQLQNGRTKLNVWQRVVRNEKGETVSTSSSEWIDSAEKPSEKLTVDFEPVWINGEGKERELDHARSSAVWPEATDDELSVEPETLRATLTARHPKLMRDFRADVENAGFSWEPERN